MITDILVPKGFAFTVIVPKLEFTIFSCIKFFSFSDNYCVTCLRFDRRQARNQFMNAAKADHVL